VTKGQLEEGAADVFSPGGSHASTTSVVDVKSLHADQRQLNAAAAAYAKPSESIPLKRMLFATSATY